MVDARKLVESKAEDYGHPLDFCATVRDAWDVLLASPHRKFHGTEEEPSNYDRAIEHCLYQILGKMVRVLHNPTHLDSIQDIAGYAECLELCRERVEPKEVADLSTYERSFLPARGTGDTRAYTLELRGQHFSITPSEYAQYAELVRSGSEPEEAAQAVYDRVCAGVGAELKR